MKSRAERETDEQTVKLVTTILMARHQPHVGYDDPKLKSAFPGAFQIAIEHGVAPALAKGVRNLVKQDWPWSDLLPFVEFAENANRNRNATFMKSATGLRKNLRAVGVDPIFLKGAAFLLDSGQDPNWRTMVDLDVLVDQNALAKSIRELLNAGYVQQSDWAGFKEGVHHHYPALNDPEGTMIEVHLRITQDPKTCPVTTWEIEQQAMVSGSAGEQFRLPCPTHRFIHLVAHAQLSNWGWPLRHVYLKDLLDAVELQLSHQLDWDLIRSSLQRVGAEAQLMGFLCAARQLLNLEMPFSQADLRDGEDWAREAIAGLSGQRSTWHTAMLATRQYLSSFVRDPSRLKLIWKTLKEPARRRQLIDINRRRLK